MNYFLNLFPLVRIFSDLGGVPSDDLVNALVLFDEDEEEIMRGFSNFCLD
jgi:hypothetical protein